MKAFVKIGVVISMVTALAACGSSAATRPPRTASPRPTPRTLADLGTTTTDERVLVPLTHGMGSRGFSGGVFSGKTLNIEIACIDGSYTVSYAGGSMTSKCDGTPEMISDEAANFRIGHPTSFTLTTNARWVFRVTEMK